MKKSILFFALLLAGRFCFAQTDENYARVNSLLQSGLNKNFFAIQQEAANLDEIQRLSLYNAHNIQSGKIAAGAALDFFLGFGIGNFLQKDYLAGGIALGGDLVASGLMLSGTAMLVVYPLFVFGATREDDDTAVYDDGMFKTAVTLMFSGGFVLLASRIFGLIRTFVFPSSYNNKLRTALNISDLTLTMNIEPSLGISDKGYELTLVHFRY
jgi:hypothetical protein